MNIRIWKKRKEIARVLVIALLAGLLGSAPQKADAEGTGSASLKGAEYHTIRISTEGLEATTTTCSVELVGVETPTVETPSMEKPNDGILNVEGAETPEKEVTVTKEAQVRCREDKKTADVSVTLEDSNETWAKEVMVEVDGKVQAEKAKVEGKKADFQVSIPEKTTQPPTVSPTASPTSTPTVTPTSSPTASPTASPTSSPTASPTSSPTASPTSSPTVTPTSSPTASPTSTPTVTPTSSPTASPTSTPTVTPTSSPTVSPTATPTASPTASPTSSPTSSPTASPTSSPTTPPPSQTPPSVLPPIPTSSAPEPPTPAPTEKPDGYKTDYEVSVGSTIPILLGREKPDSLKAANAAAKKIVKISKNKVTGLKAGTAKLTAVYKGKKYSVTVKVPKPSISLKAVIDLKRTLKYSKRYNKKLKVYSVKPVYKNLNGKQVKNCSVTYKFKGRKYKINVNKMRSYDYILKKLKCQVTVKMKNGIPPVTVKKIKIKF